MRVALDRLVRDRAGGHCEYCRWPEAGSHLAFPIDHVIARQHDGVTESGNLALSCPSCNTHKGPNIASIDPQDGSLVRLFHPRRDRWDEHFAWRDAEIVGLTPVGRVTIRVLCMNDELVLALRRSWIAEGSFPPLESPIRPG